MNTSATGGYLSPDGQAVPNDTAFEDILQAHVVGITGLNGAMVRPRWQIIVPKMPEPEQDWCAVGVMSSNDPDSPYIDQNGHAFNHEVIEVLASFYGPKAEHYAKLLKRGLAIPQNNQQLKHQHMTFIDAQSVVVVPELINMQWLRRCDVQFTLRRLDVRHYPIQQFNKLPEINLGKE